MMILFDLLFYALNYLHDDPIYVSLKISISTVFSTPLRGGLYILPLLTGPLVLVIPIDVVEINGKVEDSTCVVFSVPLSEVYDMTIGLEDSRALYNYSYATMSTSSQARIYDFPEAPFEYFGHEVTYFLPKVTTHYKFENPNMQVFFMVRVPTAQGPGFPKVPRTSLPKGNRVTKKVRFKIKVYSSSCYYYQLNAWYSDENCKPLRDKSHKGLKCVCRGNGPFSAKRTSLLKYITFRGKESAHYYGPNFYPAIFTSILLVLFLFYAYWGHYQDIQEKNSAQTHVIKDFFNPESPNQYLVCLATGIMPGSGTTNRVAFLLVGQLASFQFVMPKGTPCHS
ncbi:hypothetical protein RRG08_047195, partial [Elysia crispata]